MSEGQGTTQGNHETPLTGSNKEFIFDPRESFSFSIFFRLQQILDIAHVVYNLGDVKSDWGSSSIAFHEAIRMLNSDDFGDLLQHLPVDETECSYLIALRGTPPRMSSKALERFRRDCTYDVTLEIFTNLDYTMDENAYFSTAEWSLDLTLDWMLSNMSRVRQSKP